MLLAFALRVYKLDEESIWTDESVSYRYLDAPSLREFLTQERSLDPPMAPGYFVVEYYWAKWVGLDLYRVRMLSVLFEIGRAHV